MEGVDPSFMGMPVTLSRLSVLTMNDNFLLVHGFSAFTHLGFLLLVFISCFCKKISFRGPKQMPNYGVLFYRQTLLSCVVLVVLNLVMCFLNLLYWYTNGWSKQNIVTFSDTVVRTLVWLFISVYLHNHVSKYRFALRIWWFSSFLIVCFCLVLDCVFYKQVHSLAAQFLVLDASSAIVGLFLCYVGFLAKNEGGTISHSYHEPLLEGETITRSATSNIFSLLTFSWIHPLISVGYKKRLDLEDVPQLDRLNSAQRLFSVLRNKIEMDKSKSIQMNTLSLVKAVVSTTWKDIIITGLLSFVYTLASYVGPFLIDTLVKYLNGHRNLKEGFLLVSAFIVAKIVECLAQRHCDFKLQQVGINVRAALVAMIYHKGLTLSSQSKQGHSNGEIINFMAVDAERIGDFSKYMHNAWLVVVQVGLALAILYKYLGISSLATFVATIVVMLSNLPLGRLQEEFQEKLMKCKDKRMKTTSEILKNMRILKLYGWEMKFLSRINDIRNDEAHWLYKLVFTMAMTCVAFWVAPTCVAIATFGLVFTCKDGRITQAGKYDDITKLGSDFLELVGAHKQALLEIDFVGHNLGTVKKNIQDETITGQNGNLVEEKKRQLVEEEERERGKVSSSAYWKYLTTAYGGALTLLVLLAEIMFESSQIGSNYWLAWASSTSESNEARVGGFEFIIVYVAFGIGCSFCILVRSFLLMKAGYETANRLFYKMNLCIFRAPMSFFDANPSGRILNRVSTDQTAADLTIPYLIGPFAYVTIQLFGIILVMSLGAWPVFLVFFPVVGICIWLQQYYMPSARELARLVGVCKAPVIQHFSETISGSTTIRSFDQEHRFQDTCLKLIDDYSRPKFHVAAALDWLGLRLDMLSSFIFAFLLIFLVSVPEGIIDPSTAGLAVTYGLNLNMLQAWAIEKLCKLEIQFISVERIFQYSSIPSEPPLVIDSNRPDHFWPSQGKVDIHHLQVRYAPHMPLVLRGITCTFHGGKKTGIVGRTGSGKSTLIQTLFRLVEPTNGEILIDGINISSIGLHDLRSRLSIIPQDPTMFDGTVRSNMDPLEDYTDDQIWEALDKCLIGDEVRNKEGKLDATVTENGENWSVGQRQLICLGRVLLKKSKILVLDEATVSVDTATDNMIQKTLREHFSDSTVIAIAHRITSVVKSDMVLVLNNGSCLVEEYDSPTTLLEDTSSSFSQLVMEYSMRSNSSHVTSYS
ncbi:putative ABC-type xenobiotic transporter [Helianthus anomalus]